MCTHSPSQSIAASSGEISLGLMTATCDMPLYTATIPAVSVVMVICVSADRLTTGSRGTDAGHQICRNVNK
jgi:ethanolamine utilization microcompartment shell protein EutL